MIEAQNIPTIGIGLTYTYMPLTVAYHAPPKTKFSYMVMSHSQKYGLEGYYKAIKTSR